MWCLLLYVSRCANGLDVHFTFMTGGNKAKRSFAQLVWLLCTWVMWNEGNHCLFNNIVTYVPRLLDKVKLLALGWLKAKNVMFVFGIQRWWSSPLACLALANFVFSVVY